MRIVGLLRSKRQGAILWWGTGKNVAYLGARCGGIWRCESRVAHDGASDYVSAQGLFDFVNPVGAFEDFAGLGSVGGADDSVALHEIDEMSGTSVTDTQATLQ